MNKAFGAFVVWVAMPGWAMAELSHTRDSPPSRRFGQSVGQSGETHRAIPPRRLRVQDPLRNHWRSKAYLAPWTIETTLSLMPDAELTEVFCDSQDRILQHSRIDPEPPEPRSQPLREARPW